MGKNLTKDQREQIFKMLGEGKSCAEIGDVFKRSASTIKYYLTAFNKKGGTVKERAPADPSGPTPSQQNIVLAIKKEIAFLGVRAAALQAVLDVYAEEEEKSADLPETLR